MTKFNIGHENDLINTGNYFWCRTCCTARPVSERVKDGRCRSCDQSLKHEAVEIPLNLCQTPQDENLSDLPMSAGKPAVKNGQGVLL